MARHTFATFEQHFTKMCSWKKQLLVALCCHHLNVHCLTTYSSLTHSIHLAIIDLGSSEPERCMRSSACLNIPTLITYQKCWIFSTDVDWPLYLAMFYIRTSLYAPQQMHLDPLIVVCQWWHWLKEARSESLGADQHWDLVKWSLVTLCSTGEGDSPLTPLAQCLALVQPHTPSPTSILVQCMKWELHQLAILGWVDTAVGVGSRWQLTTVSARYLQGLSVCSGYIILQIRE